jgi:hypothetical protein
MLPKRSFKIQNYPSIFCSSMIKQKMSPKSNDMVRKFLLFYRKSYATIEYPLLRTVSIPCIALNHICSEETLFVKRHELRSSR